MPCSIVLCEARPLRSVPPASASAPGSGAFPGRPGRPLHGLAHFMAPPRVFPVRFRPAGFLPVRGSVALALRLPVLLPARLFPSGVSAPGPDSAARSRHAGDDQLHAARPVPRVRRLLYAFGSSRSCFPAAGLPDFFAASAGCPRFRGAAFRLPRRPGSPRGRRRRPPRHGFSSCVHL